VGPSGGGRKGLELRPLRAIQHPWLTWQSQRQAFAIAGDAPAIAVQLFMLSVHTTGCGKEAMGLRWVSKCYDKSAEDK